LSCDGVQAAYAFGEHSSFPGIFLFIFYRSLPSRQFFNTI